MRVFKTIGFHLEIKTNLHNITFPDIAFSLINETYHFYNKHNDKILYVHTLLNHLPQIIKQLPFSITEGLRNNSSDETIFESTKLQNQEIIIKSDHKSTLKKKLKKLLREI